MWLRLDDPRYIYSDFWKYGTVRLQIYRVKIPSRGTSFVFHHERVNYRFGPDHLFHMILDIPAVSCGHIENFKLIFQTLVDNQLSAYLIPCPAPENNAAGAEVGKHLHLSPNPQIDPSESGVIQIHFSSFAQLTAAITIGIDFNFNLSLATGRDTSRKIDGCTPSAGLDLFNLKIGRA